MNMGDFAETMEQFRDAFGGGGARRRERPSEIAVTMNASLDELGKRDIERDASFDITETCAACKGARHAPGSTMIACKKCDGSGAITHTTRIPLMGSFQTRGPCPTCKGRGDVPQKACATCKGDGEVVMRKTLRVKVPKGIQVEMMGENGKTMRGEVDMQFRVRLEEL